MKNSAKYRLGLDLGTNSIGWAAVELDGDGNPRGAAGSGRPHFPGRAEGRQQFHGRGSPTLWSVVIARGQRRRRDRYLTRRERLMQALVELRPDAG